MRWVGAMQAALAPHHSLVDRLRYRAWLGGMRLVDHSVEGTGYKRSRLVLVELAASSRRTFEDKFSASRFVSALTLTYAELGFAPWPRGRRRSRRTMSAKCEHRSQ